MKKIKLIVGLANKGKEYTQTRHNVGSWYLKKLAKKYNQILKEEKKFLGYTTIINCCDSKLHLLIPSTFINFSGQSVAKIVNFYHIKSEEVLIVHDELDFVPGIAKFKIKSSYSGHNGIKNISTELGLSFKFYRLRIGIGRPINNEKINKFVLNKPSFFEKKLIDKSIDKAINCTEDFLNNPLKAMDKLHAFKASID
ncbi:aminoacyl-tRNA hydrolase [Candidatus Tachikawaea gelatinosa]|uniref:Peptidyl-tRNA hydrolase n=1 Tax=Candidatus Tachikawaea gelatinosa TaxID=1410383 RepID=A0A090BWH5_9ENTR|nr:aminoacyl-tRNA hydrolase [Candidatus Tachikawaea gelatinosa]BAP58616.1 peptidyl-tRNA hydrolase [Candidatus Tachikawaea gelatinosa]